MNAENFSISVLPSAEQLFSQQSLLIHYTILSNRDYIIIEKKKRRCYYRHITILNPGIMIE